MKIGILCACAPEFEPFRAALNGEISSVCGAKYVEGMLCGKEVCVLFCGLGKVNAAMGAAALVRELGCARVIMSGAAGAIAKGLHIGQCIMIADCVYHDLLPELITQYHPNDIDPDFKCSPDIVELGHSAGMKCGRTVTGDVFIADDGRESIIERFDPLCCDMESAAAAHACFLLGAPFNCVRAISDTEDEAGLGSFEKNVEFAAQKAFDGVCDVLEKL